VESFGCAIANLFRAQTRDVGHDCQSVPEEIGAHFHLIAERQTFPPAGSDVEL